MNHRFRSSIFAILLALPLAAQTKVWTAPRTPDGQPDLQGVWSNPTITPFERPAEFAGKATLTEKEAADLEARAAKARVDGPPKEGD
ncbi:MAG TPA: hypothetical protein VLM42_16685, partial [Bryobacteraceae bacterium]|nr:hypothetical protein [Bryobacteraceae bacterium]